MTPLEAVIRARIAQAGPMSVAEYMALCLGHPQHGYYMRQDPLGAAGDFTTAPEISQMFGEMIGIWARAVAPGLPLIELGPGRGTLMADILRVTGPRQVWFVETSPTLRAEQASRVPDAQFVETLAEVSETPALILANEFFDALPVRQYLQTPEGWRERQVGLVADQLTFGLSAPLPLTPPRTDWWEQSALAEGVAAEIARRVAMGGAALIIDYGYRAADRPKGPTLQALRRHAPAGPLAAPGEADLTWLPDFDALAEAFTGLDIHHAEQGAFLARLGIGMRAEALAKARPTEAASLADALERLTAPAQMGTLFKVLGVTPPGTAIPPGFS
ncbi:MAG: SAM-dependent methyltransferase [Pseudomonadota bacterium]